MTLVSVGMAMLAGCYTGLDHEPDAEGPDATADDDGQTDPVGDPAVWEMVGENGLRRLTAAEYGATIRDLLGVEVDAALLLPEDWRQPFDNDATTQLASQALIEGAELLASDIAAAALETAEKRSAIVGCEPMSNTDADCFRSFIEDFGRRALRRPLTVAEADRFIALLAEAQITGDFYAAVEVALRAMLQHPAFLYRVELGTPVSGQEGLFRLDDYEMATRLSYFVWGSAPSDGLLDRAAEGQLTDPDSISAAVEDMLLDERARARVARFHALWLGYEQLSHAPALAAAMQAETKALIDRVIFEDSMPWQELLRAEETFIDDTLAEHYGLPAPDGSAWVDYGETERRGLLSHGAFLSSMANVDDSSPTKRGILVRTRLMCQDIMPPPPEVVVDDVEPGVGQCKEELYREGHSVGACVGCHDQMDPIGLGLENYDRAGAYRTVEKDDPDCVISGEGHVDGVPFRGPSELADVLLDSGTLNQCVARQLYRFAVGRTELDANDERFVTFLIEDIPSGGEVDFAAMIRRFVTAEAFMYRRNETQTEGAQ